MSYEERKACLDAWKKLVGPDKIAKKRTDEVVGGATVIKQPIDGLVED